MTDAEIISRFWERSEDSIRALSEKYGAYCLSIAHNILSSEEDAEECLDDAYLHVWNSVPPEKPLCLSAYVGRIVRNLAISRLRHNTAKKRGEVPLILDELEDLVSGGETPEDAFDRTALIGEIRSWLSGQSERDRKIFIRRYFYAEKLTDTAKRYALSKGHVSMILTRMRRELSAYLTERGYTL